METLSKSPLFTIFHFNDVYDIQPNKKGRYGIVKFDSHIKYLQSKYPNNLLLFSGDAFSPSILSNIFEGKQMVTALNKLKIDAACYGNHQFDYDSKKTMELAKSCNFPWLLGNIRYIDSEQVLGDGIPNIIKENFGKKIGIFGVAGQDWLGIVNEQYQGLLEYDDVGLFSQNMCYRLKNKDQCDFIIALTHQRVPEDQRLPIQQPNIDIVLGGHDHIVMKEIINGVPVIKSGDNFKMFGIIHVYEKDKYFDVEFKGKRYDFDISFQEIPDECQGIDEELKQYVDICMEKYSTYDSVIGYTEVPLDTRFCNVRTEETNYGNFLSDLARNYFDSDCSLINSGTIRADLLVPPGELKYSFLSNIINNLLIVKKIPGKILLQALEYSIFGLPVVYSGGFFCVSGIKFTYSLNKSPRVQNVWVKGEQLDLEKDYSVVLPLFVSMGGDGFDMLKQCEFIVDQVSGIDIMRLILKFFRGGQQITQKLLPEPENDHQNKVEMHEQENQIEVLPIEILTMGKRKSTRSERISIMKRKIFIDNHGDRYVCIFPMTEGRITCID